MSVGVAFTGGECEDAIDYYCNIFDLKAPEKPVRYGDFVQFDYPKEIAKRIYMTELNIYGNSIYLFDAPNDKIVDKGNNVRIVIETCPDNLYNAYMKFGKDSIVDMEPQKVNNQIITTFIDKFGIYWHFIARI